MAVTAGGLISGKAFLQGRSRSRCLQPDYESEARQVKYYSELPAAAGGSDPGYRAVTKPQNGPPLAYPIFALTPVNPRRPILRDLRRFHRAVVTDRSVRRQRPRRAT